MAVSIALICVLGYLLGGINGAILLSKLVEKDDVRRHGSGNAGFYEYGVLLEGNEYALWGAVHVREEKRDSSTNGIILSDQTFTPELDLEFEETEKGFRFSFPNEYWGHGFRFYAKENSELILHNYICYYDGNYVSTISWKEQSQGFYVMVSENQMIMDFYLDGRLERAE